MLEAEGRSIGAAAAYQEMLAEAVRLLEDLPSAETVSMIDRVRLMEILAGAEKALALLDGAPVSDRP